MSSKEIYDKCGVGVVIANHAGEDVSAVAANLGYGQTNRGHEGAGMGAKRFDGGFSLYRGTARFAKVFPSMSVVNEHGLNGEIVQIHTRYRTTGASHDTDYAQPMLVEEHGRVLMGGHNGNVINAPQLYDELKQGGVHFATEGKVDENGIPYPVSDSEILLRFIARSPGATWADRVEYALKRAEGSFSLVLTTDDNQVIIGRDPWGVRPLSYGRLNGYWVAASETSPMDKMRVSDQVEVQKGQLVVFKPGQEPQTRTYDDTKKLSFCDLEDFYILNPNSRRGGIEAVIVRELLGAELAREEVASGRLVSYAQLVTPSPDSGRPSAGTFAEGIQKPYRERIFKERYSEIFDSEEEGARSFIGSDHKLRDRILEAKFHVSGSLEDEVLYVVDDTGIRLKTLEKLARYLKTVARVREIHARFSAPYFVRPCLLGVNINSRKELGALKNVGGIWMKKSDAEIAHDTGVDSVGFLTPDGLDKVREEHMHESREGFCGYCLGRSGPGFDMSKYDPELLFEGTVDRRVLAVV